LEFGMDFEDEETEDERTQARDHTPPPTTTYRPMRKISDAEK
jgi:hypothetical protein